MKRGDLSWALSAVLPHTGSRSAGTDVVGVAPGEGGGFAFATDKYTLGVARFGLDHRSVSPLCLPAKEATELERFIRPSYKDEADGDVVYARQPGEFHVSIDRQVDRTGTLEQDTAVFETGEDKVYLHDLFGFIRRTLARPVEFDECIYQPELMQKFGKAKRHSTDRLRILPRHADDRRGVAVVTVGTDFVGAISGLTYDDLGSVTAADFLGELFEAA